MIMLMLLLRIGSSRYALDTRSVLEVIPRVELTQSHGLSPAITGIFNYQGQVVPVIDLGQLLVGNPSAAHLSTRIVLVKTDGVKTDQGNPQSQVWGLQVEQVTETLASHQVHQAVDRTHRPQNSHFGEIFFYQQEMIQRLCIDRLLAQHLYKFPLTLSGEENHQALDSKKEVIVG